MVLSARLALERRGWVLTDQARWKFPEPYASLWKDHMYEILKDTPKLFRKSFLDEQRPGDVEIIMTCRARRMLRKYIPDAA